MNMPNNTSNTEEEYKDLLYRAVLSLRTRDECRRLFEDLCTISEIQAMSQRMQVALMLEKGNIYHEIGQATGASTATISRVNKALRYGSDGYRVVLDRLKENPR